MWKHMPNFLCMLRILAVPVFVMLLVWDFEEFDATFGARLAILVYFLASITDYFDGRIAREYHLESKLGTILDPLADKLLIIAGFLCPFYRGLLPWWMIVLVFLREIIVVFYCIDGISKKVVMPPVHSGKVKTALQMTTIVMMLLLMAATSDVYWSGLWLVGTGVETIITAVITVIVWAGLAFSYYSLLEITHIYIREKRKWNAEHAHCV